MVHVLTHDLPWTGQNNIHECYLQYSVPIVLWFENVGSPWIFHNVMMTQITHILKSEGGTWNQILYSPQVPLDCGLEISHRFYSTRKLKYNGCLFLEPINTYRTCNISHCRQAPIKVHSQMNIQEKQWITFWEGFSWCIMIWL